MKTCRFDNRQIKKILKLAVQQLLEPLTRIEMNNLLTLLISQLNSQSLFYSLLACQSGLSSTFSSAASKLLSFLMYKISKLCNF